MTQAPATTVATAVRQHGGGRHPLNLLCTAPTGRLQDSCGGVINRRAEGATSSNTLPASCAAAAHPTTGVRRARELSPSLRSQIRPPAQLVKGYGQPLKPLDRLKSVSSQGEKNTRSLAVVRLLPLINLQEALNASTKFDHRIDKTNVRQAHRINRFDSRQRVVGSLNTTALRHVAYHLGRADSEVKYDRGFVCTPCNQLHSANNHCSSLILSTLLTSSLIPNRVNRCGYSSHAPSCLRPIGSTVSYAPISGCAYRQPKQGAAHQDYPKRPKTSLPHLLRDFQSRHPQQLRAELYRSSLPAPRHHVQRGAA